MNKDQLIKVYGTLKNHTVDSAISDGDIHNDALALASDLYDDQFGESPKVNNFLDIINKRIKGIKRETDGNTPGTHVNEDLYVDGDIYIKVNNQWQKLSLGDLINRITNLESLWEHYTENNTTYVRPKKVDNKNVPVLAPGFFDSTVS